ncbi:MAG: hypothetical protein AAGE52_08320 [Myxococcota bacterium]
MKRSVISLIALTTLLATACSDEPPVNRVGVNVVDKGLFTGSWYYSRVVIDVDYEAAGVGTYPGDAASDFVDPTVFNTSMPRIRWVIDEDFLFAYRDYEIIEGINPDGEGDGEATHPVAAFEIESHFDIRRAYSTTTGEEQNVLVENTTDRRWYEREYMRVDWSMNHLPAYYGQIANLFEVIGFYNREPSELYIQGQSDFPESWRPTFDFMGCQGLDDESESCSREERDWAEDYAAGDLYHFSFVTQELLSPGNIPDPFTGRPVNWCVSIFADAPTCTTTAIFIRNAFLKVSDTRQYEPVNWLDSRHDIAGYFRNERRTYDRSSAADDPAFGFTDFLNYNANRQNIWRDWVDAEGNPVPYADRRVRQNVWYNSTELPAHLVEPSFDLTSRWNEVYMRMVRNLRGQPEPSFPRVACQEDDPQGYCYCARDTDGTIITPDCAGQYDPFETPDQARARGVENPYDCSVTVPEGAQPNMNNPGLSDRDFEGWFDAEMVGSECVIVLRNNTCNLRSIRENGGILDGLGCQERGDLRFKFMSYVDQPGTGFLGVATMRTDPITGEIIAGDANIGGPALDGYRTSALQAYDVINGTIRREDIIIGEDIRDAAENADNVQFPAAAREEFVTPPIESFEATRHETLVRRMDAYMDRARNLEGPEGRLRAYTERLQSLAGTDIERRLMANVETLAMAGFDHLPDGYGPADINDNILDRVSPFRTTAADRISYQNDVERRIGESSVMMPNEFTDNSVLEFVERHADYPRARLEIELNQMLMYQTQLHEMGHCLGLRHSFMASTDSANYDDGYYTIDAAIPLPNPEDFDGGINGLDPTEIQAYNAAYTDAKRRRELAGIERWMDSSIMEYTAQWYERSATGTGRYDDMAINLAYGDLVEIYDNSGALSADEINPINTERVWVKYYHGGEACSVAADCPYSSGGARSAELLAGNRDAGLTQQCVTHPDGGAFGNICSNFNSDAAAQAAASPTPSYMPVPYRFCTDDRVGTHALCHRFDEGDSYREIVQNVAEQYDRQYIFTNFRRYRSSFSIGGYLFNRLIGRQFNILQSIFQDLLFRYSQDPTYADLEGDFGFDDHFLATADVLNFYARIISQPGIGAYRWDEGWQRYERRNTDPRTPGAQLALPLGMARYPNSEYQNGLTGITRIELIGTFYEKWFTMQMLTQRGFTSSYTRDVPFFTNFYDLYPAEIQQIFQGLIVQQPEAIAPRLVCASGGTEANRTCTDPTIIYPDFYRGDCSIAATCRPDTQTIFGDMPIVSARSNVTLQFLAAVFGLSDLPTFFDSTFQNQLFVCIEGNGQCFAPTPADVEFIPGVTTVEEADYARFFSDRYGKSFIARKVEPSEGIPNQVSIGFEMVREAEETQFLLDVLQNFRGDFGGTPLDLDNLTAAQQSRVADIDYDLPTTVSFLDSEVDRLDDRRRELESFFFQLIQLENQFGVRSYLRF